MISKAAIAVFIGLFGAAAAAENSLREGKESATRVDDFVGVEHLDLELEVDGERQLFPLLPGTSCPKGHVCRVRTGGGPSNVSPMVSSLKDNLKTPLAATMNWNEFNDNLKTIVASDDYCSRRSAMARAAGLAAGVAVATVNAPAYAAEKKTVKMGTDSGLLAFEPKTLKICSGDTVEWVNNKAGPHNVVFDEDDIPAGVDQEAISMEEQLGEEGDTFSMKFTTAGNYGYYCEPHRGAGMAASLTVA